MFYTYIHIRNDTREVFYVGKGKDDRITSRRSRNNHWRSVVDKAGYTAEIVALWFTELEAYKHEKLLIGFYKSIGIKLCNQTTGGEGVMGLVHSEESKRKFSEATKKMWDDPESKEKRKSAMKKGWESEKSKEKARQNLEKMKASLDKKAHSEFMREVTKIRWADPEFKEKQRLITKKRWADTEFKEKMRELHRERHKKLKAEKQNPDTLTPLVASCCCLPDLVTKHQLKSPFIGASFCLISLGTSYHPLFQVHSP